MIMGRASLVTEGSVRIGSGSRSHSSEWRQGPLSPRIVCLLAASVESEECNRVDGCQE